MPITIWLGAASNWFSFSSQRFQPSLALVNVVGLTTTLLSGRVTHPEQDWLPMSIPQTYLISAPSTEGLVGVVSIAHLAFLFPPFLGFHPAHPITGMSTRESRPTRASVSSSWIGNLTLAAAFHLTAGCCNKPDRPLRLWLAGSRLEKEVTAFRRPQANYSGSPAATKLLYEPNDC